MADNYRTPLISSAIEMAARNLRLPDGAVFHSDRGSNYTSAEFADLPAGDLVKGVLGVNPGWPRPAGSGGLALLRK